MCYYTSMQLLEIGAIVYKYVSCNYINIVSIVAGNGRWACGVATCSVYYVCVYIISCREGNNSTDDSQ